MIDALARGARSYVGVKTFASTGSGSVVGHGKDGTYILTCHHVVTRPQKLRVLWPEDGKIRYVGAEVVRADKALDLALLKTGHLVDRIPIDLADDLPELYCRCYTLGSASGRYGAGGEVILCGADGSTGSEHFGKLLMFSGLIVCGMSGGMLLNSDGELIGVPHLSEIENEVALNALGYAVPLKTVKAFLKRWLPKGVDR